MMAVEDDIKEIVEDISYAFSTVMRQGCFDILIAIRDHQKILHDAIQEKNHVKALYHNNKIFWEMGICIANRLDTLPHNTSSIFENISKKLLEFYKLDTYIAFEADNLRLCYKLTQLVEEDYFDYIATQFSWEHLRVLLENCNDTIFFQTIAHRAIRYRYSPQKIAEYIHNRKKYAKRKS